MNNDPTLYLILNHYDALVIATRGMRQGETIQVGILQPGETLTLPMLGQMVENTARSRVAANVCEALAKAGARGTQFNENEGDEMVTLTKAELLATVILSGVFSIMAWNLGVLFVHWLR